MDPKQLEEDLLFIKEVLNELSVNPEDYDFGPAYSLAKERKQLANIKLNRLIRAAKFK